MKNGSNERYKWLADAHTYYVINDCVTFQPATNMLCNIHNPALKVTLSVPAGRCLQLLINNIGNIVTQQDFMDIAWKQSGMKVTSNTYYQNISILRRSLIHAGLEDNTIITLPRIGLTLATGTQIRKLVTETTPEVETGAGQSDENTEVEEYSHRPPATTLPTTCEYAEQVSPSPAAEHRFLPPSLTRTNIYRMGFSVKNGVLLAISLAFITLLFSYLTEIKDNYFSDYVKIATAQRCHVLSAKAVSESVKMEVLNKYDQHITGDCVNYPWVYVTTLADFPRTSIIRCNKPFTQSTLCISEYFIE
ncbi:TPA: transcriptional regulator [Raoultella ornithinolytica]